MFTTLLAVLLASAAPAARGALRGVNPDLGSHYSGNGGTFTCITGVPKTIPFSRVNDDYCDCPDGSDEPGTAACHNGRFYCRNLGHEPRLLASAFVDDGVCDCCDGTDEPKGKCKNTCLEASAVHKEALRNKILNYEQALQTKVDYVSRARVFKEELSLKEGTIEEDITKQLSEVQRLKDEVARLEQEEAARRAEEEAAKAEEARLAAEAAAAAAASTPDRAAPAEEAPAAGSAAEDERKLQEEAQETHAEEREETPEERGRRIASQWTNDPEAAAVPDSDDDVTDDQSEEGGYEPDDNRGDYDQGVENHQEDQSEQQYQHHQHHRQRPPRRPDSNTPLGEARARLYDAEAALGRLQQDKENIRTYLKLGLDFGPDDVFLALADRCYSSHQTRWTYEICMFKTATQREGYSNSVTVGRWAGFADNYKTMVFSGGDECWNVGPRSFTVSMSCGWEEQLSDGEEPATCAYTGKFTSPALCSEQELEDLYQQLSNLEAFEREVQALINSEEQANIKDEL